MQIILDSSLEKLTPRYDRRALQSMDGLVNTIQGKLGDKHQYLHSSFEGSVQLGFLGMLSTAYSQHEKVEIAPHDIWYLILSEVALIIKSNVEACRTLFTSSQGKVDILVPIDDPTQIDLQLVISKLRELIPVPIDCFIPALSTTTEDAQIAMYAALCDGVSPYYNYMTFCCGIPEIRLLGTVEDWDALIGCASSIGTMFDSVKVDVGTNYLFRVVEILHKIRATFDTIDTAFWKDIYTERNVGSGGELAINGWITKLYYEKRSLNKIENFQQTFTIVPYINIESGRRFKGVYGGFQKLRTDDDHLKTGYGSLVFEELDEAVKKPTEGLFVVRETIEGVSRKLIATWDVDSAEWVALDKPEAE